MLTVYDIKSQTMIDSPDFFELISDFTDFKGVSYVSSFKVIEKLNSMFESIELILGLEESTTGKFLQQIYDVGRRTRELENASGDLLVAIENGKVHLKFNKDVLFHSKYYILTNKQEFAWFTGSMNLTDAALYKNHENLAMYRGSFSDAEDMATYRQFEQLFVQDFGFNSVDYIDRKTITVFRQAQTSDRHLEIIEARIVEHDAAVINAEPIQEIARILGDPRCKLEENTEKTTIKYELGSPTVLRTLKATYNAKGNRRNVKAAKEELRKVRLKMHESSPSQNEDQKLSKAEPQWVYTEQEHEILVKGQDDALEVLENCAVNELDVSTFVDIVNSYNFNKMRDESHQAMSAFLFAMTAPVLWRIRKLVMETGFNPDQIPVMVAILGSGSSGKTTIVDDYFKPFIGDISPLLSEERIKSVYGATNTGSRGPIAFMNEYMDSGEISPLIIDEMSTDFLTKPAVQSKIKHWANSRTNELNGPQGTIILTSNADGAVLEESIKKRLWYLSITSDYKPKDQQEYNFSAMAGLLNNHMYRHVVFKLNERLDTLTTDEVVKFTENFLWLTADIVKQLLAAFGFENAFPDKLFVPYRYEDEIAQQTIKDTIYQANAKGSLSFDSSQEDYAVMLRSAWEATGSYAKNQKNEMDEFKALVPANCIIDATQKAITLSIKATDAYLGVNLLEALRYSSPINSVPKDKYLESRLREETVEKENLILKFELEKQAILKEHKKKRRWFRFGQYKKRWLPGKYRETTSFSAS